MMGKSIEQFEKDYWKKPSQSTSLIEKCHNYRKIPVENLSVEQLRLLISQKIGLKYIVPVAIDQLEQNILSEGDYYKGDLLITISKIEKSYFDSNPEQRDKLRLLVSSKQDLLKTELGHKKTEQINENLEI